MAKTLTLVPCNTKYASIDYEGHTYEIWKVNPRTGKEGTEVEYKLAVGLLSLDPPVVTILPVIKDGKFVQQLDAKDAEKVALAHSSADNVLMARATTVENDFGTKDQTKLIAKQAEEIERLKAQIAGQDEASADSESEE